MTNPSILSGLNGPVYFRIAGLFLLILLMEDLTVRIHESLSDIQQKKNREELLGDPSGCYIYDSSYNHNHFYSGNIQLLRSRNEEYIMDFFICKGAPSYNSGSFRDTVQLDGNRIHWFSEYDESCKLTFELRDSGIMIQHAASNYNSSCGFGHGVVAHGFFRKR